MEASGYPEYYHADQPWKMPGRFGEDFDFNAHIIRNATPDSWLNLKFGTLTQTRDADHDGVPDDDPSLPFDEKRRGGDPTMTDTDGDGLNDFQEVMAGTSRGCLLSERDTDGDRLIDGNDPEILYSTDPIIYPVDDKGAQTLRWGRGLWEFGAMQPVYGVPSTALRLGWDSTFLYFLAEFLELDAESQKERNILLQIDANNDGWFHGFDNFQIRARLSDTSAQVIECYLRDCASWTDPPKDRKEILDSSWLLVSWERYPKNALFRLGESSHSRLIMRIPKNERYGLDLRSGKRLSLRLGVQSTDDRWVWNELFERNYMMQVELK
jgi:hypothetical protein